MGIGKILGYAALVGGLGVGGYFAYNHYSSESPVIRGKVITASFDDIGPEDYVLIKDPVFGEVHVNFITGGQAYRLFPCGNEFQGESEKLKGMITAGKSLEVRVKEDEGVERTACKLLRIDTLEEPNPTP